MKYYLSNNDGTLYYKKAWFEKRPTKATPFVSEEKAS